MFWPKDIWGRFADSLDDFRVRCRTVWVGSHDVPYALRLPMLVCFKSLGLAKYKMADWMQICAATGPRTSSHRRYPFLRAISSLIYSCCAGTQQGGGGNSVPQRHDYQRAAAPAVLPPIPGAIEAQEGAGSHVRLLITGARFARHYFWIDIVRHAEVASQHDHSKLPSAACEGIPSAPMYSLALDAQPQGTLHRIAVRPGSCTGWCTQVVVASLVQVFRFCAIPQVMAIGTLALCYNNHEVFTGVYTCTPAPGSLNRVLQCLQYVTLKVAMSRAASIGLLSSS